MRIYIQTEVVLVKRLTRFRFAAPANPGKLEQALYTPFAGILQNDVQGKLIILLMYIMSLC